jgi:hypothetical protein
MVWLTGGSGPLWPSRHTRAAARRSLGAGFLHLSNLETPNEFIEGDSARGSRLKTANEGTEGPIDPDLEAF